MCTKKRYTHDRISRDVTDWGVISPLKEAVEAEEGPWIEVSGDAADRALLDILQQFIEVRNKYTAFRREVIATHLARSTHTDTTTIRNMLHKAITEPAGE
jgi:hypothetical protein